MSSLNPNTGAPKSLSWRMSPPTDAAPQRSAASHFSHDVMRFFAESVLERSYEPHPSPARPDSAVFSFDPAIRAIWRRSDVLTPLSFRDRPSVWSEARPVASAIVRRLRNPAVLAQPALFRIPRLRPCGLVIHPRPKALVIVQRRPRCVWKLVRDASLAHLIDREREAARIAPELAPPVLDWQPADPVTPGAIRLAYALDTEPISASEFPEVLRQITPSLVSVYGAAGVTGVGLEVVLGELASSREALQHHPATPFTAAAAAFLCKMARALTRHSATHRVVTTYRTFAHGDIQRSNLRRTGNRVTLIDWASGGRFNVLHDLFITEFFSPTANVWREIVTTGCPGVTDGFQGWLPRYLDELATVVKIRLSPPEVGLGLLCSLAEQATKLPTAAGGDETRALFWVNRMEQLLAGTP